MSKTEFNNLSPTEQINLVNEYFVNGENLLSIFPNIINFSESAFRRMAKKYSYKFDRKLKQYVKIEEEQLKVHQDNKKAHQKVQHSHEQVHQINTEQVQSNVSCASEKVQQEVQSNVQHGYELVHQKEHLKVHQDTKKVQQANTNVQQNSDKIAFEKELKEMLDWYHIKKTKEEMTKANQTIYIDADKFGNEVVSRTFRLHEKVLNQFLMFAKKEKGAKQQELLSQALMEFMERYGSESRE